MTGANAVRDSREQRQNLLVHTRGAVQVDRFEGFDKQNELGAVRQFDFSAQCLQLTKAYRLCHRGADAKLLVNAREIGEHIVRRD
jgi:hypothetical protein